MALILLAGCKAEIGDGCSYDVDCSPNGDRICDRQQPGGYCLMLGCEPDSCPKEAACVSFTTPCPVLPPADGGVESDAGSIYDDFDEMCDQIEPNRKRNYCLRRCRRDSQCRGSYQCKLPDNGIDDDQNELELEGSSIIDLHKNDSELGFCVPKGT